MFNFDSDVLDEEYWSFEDESQVTGESPLISFAKKPGYDKDGNYGFVLSDKALDYATSVSAYVYEIWNDGETIELGETCDVDGDWDTGEFHDSFDGEWFSLPDGQNLAIYIAEWADDYIVYTSPILLNGEVTNLRIKQSYDGGIVVEGAWDGIEDSGMAAREIRQIANGDEIVPLYFSYDNDTDDPDVEGERYKVDGDFTVSYDLLQGSEYEYCFIIDDAYGDYYMADPAQFTIDDDGQIEYR